MRIIVDAFGGDNAPLEILKGAAAAKNEFGCDRMPRASSPWRRTPARC